MKVLIQTAAELAFAIVALPLYVFLVLPKHAEGGLPGFSPVIAQGVNPLLAVVAALGVLVACIVMVFVLVRVFGRERMVPKEVDQLANEFSMLDLVPVYAAAGFAEEFLFRVVCVDLCGIIVASLLFAAIHFAYWKHPLLLADVVIVGLLLGALYAFTQSLLLCALVHFAYNLAVTYFTKTGFRLSTK
ncbi:MAG: CPBP family intramembrane metalloprotease [Eggerthellaceae bacterium]|nr:CPBP family intramembrane metalloprotease [Eggerthellaceae bacterium]MBQ6390181.1 CPBP family intramembrane metalloprotease [Eggerthellaceae bacterium]